METKQFSKAKKLADDLEASFLKVYFGSNPHLLTLARWLIEGGHKDAAKELNRAISVFGPSADANIVIARIQQKFPIEFCHTLKAREIAKTLLKRRYVKDARELIAELGGTVTYEKRSIFKWGMIVVTVAGVRRTFDDEHDMARWVIKSVVPEVLSRQIC
jgi:hypothetical protein